MKAYELATRLNDEEPDYRGLAKNSAVSFEKLEQLQLTANAQLHAGILCLAGHIGSKEALRMLREAANDSDDVIRMAVAVGVCRAPRNAGSRKIIKSLLEDKSASVRQAIVLSLCSKSVRSMEDQLSNIAENDTDELVRESATARLASLSDSEGDSESYVEVLGDGLEELSDGGLLLTPVVSTAAGELIPTDATLPGRLV